MSGPTRERDEQILRMIAAKRSGMSWREMEDAFGIHWATIQSTCRKVKDADILESGEPPAKVARAYW